MTYLTQHLNYVKKCHPKHFKKWCDEGFDEAVRVSLLKRDFSDMEWKVGSYILYYCNLEHTRRQVNELKRVRGAGEVC